MPTLEVFDDIIDKSLQEKIKSTLINDLPWYFINDVTSNDSESQGRPGFFHLRFSNQVFLLYRLLRKARLLILVLFLTVR